MNAAQFDQYYKRYANVIKAIARKLARRDQELHDDLVQEGYILLWRMDLSRVKDNEDAWIRQACYNRMVSFLRPERRRMHESLDSLVDRGAQVVEDGTGVHMVSPGRKPRRTPDWDGPEEE